MVLRFSKSGGANDRNAQATPHTGCATSGPRSSCITFEVVTGIASQSIKVTFVSNELIHRKSWLRFLLMKESKSVCTSINPRWIWYTERSPKVHGQHSKSYTWRFDRFDQKNKWFRQCWANHLSYRRSINWMGPGCCWTVRSWTGWVLVCWSSIFSTCTQHS